MASYLDAVFAYFGDDSPTDELCKILVSRIESTDEELEEILDSNDGSDEGEAYCTVVQHALLQFIADPKAYVTSLQDDNPRKLGLIEIAEMLKSKAAVPTAEVQPDVKPVDDPPAAVTPTNAGLMLSDAVQVAQPPRTTPIRPSAPADVHSEQPSASQPQGDNMRREREDGQRRDGHREDGQHGHRRLTPSELIKFFDDPDAYVAKMSEDAVERNGLTELIAAIKAKKIAALGNPITREMRECVKSKRWKGIYIALLDAYLREDAIRISIAAQLRDCYLNGIYDAGGRIIGALMRQCIKDIEEGLNSSHPKEFKRRYVG